MAEALADAQAEVGASKAAGRRRWNWADAEDSGEGEARTAVPRWLYAVVGLNLVILMAIFVQGQATSFSRSKSYLQVLGIDEMLKNLEVTGSITGHADDKDDMVDLEEDVLPDVEVQRKLETARAEAAKPVEGLDPPAVAEREPAPPAVAEETPAERNLREDLIETEEAAQPEEAVATTTAAEDHEFFDLGGEEGAQETTETTTEGPSRVAEFIQSLALSRARRQQESADFAKGRSTGGSRAQSPPDETEDEAPTAPRRKPRGSSRGKAVSLSELAELRASACVGKAPAWNPFDAEQAKQLLEARGVAKPTPQSRDYRANLARGRRRMLLASSQVGNATGADVAEPRRRLLASVRRSAGLSAKPLTPRCMSERSVRKSVRGEAEEALARCMKASQSRAPCDAKDEELASSAARNLPSIKMMRKRLKCLMVNAGSGCGTTSGNVETASQGMLSASSKPPRDIPRGFDTCALVGNGPGLTMGKKGEAIDAHDAVFRFNFYAKSGLSGTKSTFRVFNKKRAEIISANRVAPSEGEHYLFWNYGSLKFMGRVRSVHKDSYVYSPELIKHLVTTYFALRRDLRRLGMPSFGCPSNLNSGLHGLFLAATACKRISLFGFSYTTSMIAARLDAVSPRLSRFHDWSADTVVLRLLALAGVIDICP